MGEQVERCKVPVGVAVFALTGLLRSTKGIYHVSLSTNNHYFCEVSESAVTQLARLFVTSNLLTHLGLPL